MSIVRARAGLTFQHAGAEAHVVRTIHPPFLMVTVSCRTHFLNKNLSIIPDGKVRHQNVLLKRTYRSLKEITKIKHVGSRRLP